MNADRIELAPGVPIRVAAWPLRSITDLGGTTIALAADPHTQLRAYEVALAADRALLWARTAEDPRFMRALAVANPDLARSLLGRTCSARRDKRTRHLETTLYRYLARASTRPQPGDLWAGATLAAWGTRPEIRRRTGRAAVAPDLRPFRELVQALAMRPAYVERGTYKLNPTLTAHDGGYVFWTPPGRAASVRRRLSGRGAGDVLSALDGASWTLSSAADAVGERLGIASAAARRIVDRLRAQTALVGGLVFPRRFSDPWQALELMEAALESDHAELWRAARLELFEVATAVARVITSAAPASILAAMDRARAVVVALASGLEIHAVEVPRAALRCDVEAPWAITLGPDARDMAAGTIDTFLRHQHADGLREPLLEAVTNRVAGRQTTLGNVEPPSYAEAPGGVVSWEAIASCYDAGPELRRRCRRLGERFDAPTVELRIPVPGGTAADRRPALAGLHCSFTHRSLGLDVLVHGVALDPTAAYARLAGLLDGDAGGALVQWFEHAFARLGARTATELVALLYDHPSPNVLAQPTFGARAVDLWDAGAETGDAEVRLGTGPDGRRLSVSIGGRPATVFVPTAANLPHDDPCHHALLLSSMHLPPLVHPGVKILSATELESSRHRPRLVLDDGVVIQARRTLVRAGDLEPLLHERGAARFAAWQRLARRHGWPELLALHGKGGSPLVVPRDSPLAIDAAFEGAGALEALVVEEYICAAWVRADDGADGEDVYVADLVIPYALALDLGEDARAEVDSAQEWAS